MRGLVQKRGAAHFEMVFAFVFFVGFVFFLFVVLKPQDVSTLSGSVIEAIHDSFEEKVYTNLSTMFIRVTNTSRNKVCLQVDLQERIFTYNMGGTGSYVTSLAGTNYSSKLMVGSSGSTGELRINNKTENYFKVQVSPEFQNSNIDNCDLQYYELGNVYERRVISHSALLNMSRDYYSNYDDLKRKLGVPSIFDFAIVFENPALGVDMKPTSGVPDIDVDARSYVVEVLKKNGELTNEKFVLMVW